MAYKLYDTPQGQFAIDWDTCVHIIKSYYRAKFTFLKSKIRKESELSINPLSWGLPDLEYLEVDWPKVSLETSGHSTLAAYRLAAVALYDKNGVDLMVRDLIEMQRRTKKYNDDFRTKMYTTTQKSVEKLNAHVTKWMGVAQVARDLSGSFLIGAATVLSGGGVALLSAGGGTALKTVGKYQDTGDAGIARIEAFQNLACVALPATGLVKIGGATKIIVATAGDTAKAMLEPGVDGATAVAMGLVGGLFSAAAPASPQLKPFETTIRQAAIPIGIEVALDQSKDKAQSALAARAKSTAITDDARRGNNRGLGARISFSDQLLLKLAVVDMSKGIGWSWW